MLDLQEVLHVRQLVLKKLIVGTKLSILQVLFLQIFKRNYSEDFWQIFLGFNGIFRGRMRRRTKSSKFKMCLL